MIALLTGRGEGAEHTEMAFVGSVHHLARRRVVNVKAVLADHVALPVGLG